MFDNLPVGWQVCQLEDITFDFQNGIGKNKQYYGSGTKVANIGDLYQSYNFTSTKSSLLQATEQEIEKYRLEYGDLLFVRSSVKKEGVAFCSVYNSTDLCLFSSFMIRAKLNQDKVFPEFLAIQLRSPRWREILINTSSTATITNISQPKLKEIPIVLPPLEEQRRIAAVLERADRLRALRRQALARLDDLVQSVFLEMFGDPVTNPMGWEIEELGEHVEFKHGYAFQSEYFKTSGDFVLLTPGNFFEKGGYKDRGEKQKYFIGEFPDEYLLEPSSMLVAMTEQAPGLLGSPLFVPNTGKFLHNQRLGLVQVDECYLNDFLFSLFNTVYFREQVHFSSTGTKVKHTSPKKMQAIKAYIPPLTLQKKYSDFLQVHKEKMADSKEMLEKLDTLFNALMQKAFQGELQFKDAEERFKQLELAL